MMARQFQVGDTFVNETATRQYQTGAQLLNETVSSSSANAGTPIQTVTRRRRTGGFLLSRRIGRKV